MTPFPGKVILVGAGPGDPEMITVKGHNALLDADVVVHDRLISPRLLALIPASTELIDVGKRPQHHPIPQPSICEILIRQARQGRSVVRLKGGDPLVFGRGYEEICECEAAGVPWQVIPGVSSATGGPGSFGIPMTMRGVARSFAVITAESGSNYEEPDHDFASLARIDTVVVLMGRKKLPRIAAQLVHAGRDASTPVACFERATFHDERVVKGTLGDIADRADQQSLKAPMVMVVGEVARATGCPYFENSSVESSIPLASRKKTNVESDHTPDRHCQTGLPGRFRNAAECRQSNSAGETQSNRATG